MGQSYQTIQSRLAIEGIERLRTPKRCKDCGALTTLKAKGSKVMKCFECSISEKKIVRAIVVAGLLLIVAGCQSPPRKASVDVRFAGQSVSVNIVR